MKKLISKVTLEANGEKMETAYEIVINKENLENSKMINIAEGSEEVFEGKVFLQMLSSLNDIPEEVYNEIVNAKEFNSKTTEEIGLENGHKTIESYLVTDELTITSKSEVTGLDFENSYWLNKLNKLAILSEKEAK